MSALLSSCLALFLLTPSAKPGQTRSQDLRVAAASDLSTVGPQLKKAFEMNHMGISVQLVNGASAMLAQQISNGAPFDVFLSANAQYVDNLVASGKIQAASVKTYAIGRLALVWRDGGHHPIRELATSHIKVVALPNPKLAPYGVAAQQALEYGGLWLRVQPKVVYGENVRQTLQFLESGNADAAITSAALLQNRTTDPIPGDWHQPIVQKCGIIAASRQQSAAQAFLDFLLGQDGQAILARFGFGPPQ